LRYNFPTSKNASSQKAAHYVIGYRNQFSKVLNFRVDYYYKKYENLISYYWQGGRKISTKQNDATGYARGVDLQLNYDLTFCSGWFSYSYLETKEDREVDDTGYFPRPTDQRHTFNFTSSWQISSGWQLMFKFLYGSGYPFTPMVFCIDQMDFVTGEKNSMYLPPFTRFDVRINRNFKLSWSEVIAYAEIINLFNEKNIIDYERYWVLDENLTIKKPFYSFPFLPNIGIKLIF